MAIVFLASVPSVAAVVQTFPFSFTQTGTTGPDTTYQFLPIGLSTGNNVMPFDPSLGTLTAFSVVWNINFDTYGTTGANGGAIRESVGGTAYLAGIPYWGAGNANQLGNGPNMPLEVSFNVEFGNIFAAPYNGTYNPALLPPVVGTDDFSVAWGDASLPLFTVELQGMSWTASAIGSVVVTYDYVPEPSSMLATMLGLVFLSKVRRRATCARQPQSSAMLSN